MKTNDKYFVLFNPPKELLNREPFSSSLQSFETALILLAHIRYPHAFLNTIVAIESAAKAALQLPSDYRIDRANLFYKLRQKFPSIKPFCSEKDEDELFKTRNKIVHFGFSNKDDSKCLSDMLLIAIPFLSNIYRHIFDFYIFPNELEVSKDLVWAENFVKKTNHYTGINTTEGDQLNWETNWFLSSSTDAYKIPYFLKFSQKLLRNKVKYSEVGHIISVIMRLVLKKWHPTPTHFEDLFEYEYDVIDEAKKRYENNNIEFQNYTCPCCDHHLKSMFLKLHITDSDELQINAIDCVFCWLSIDDPLAADLFFDTFMSHKISRKEILEGYGIY